MTPTEKIALISYGISARVEQYQRVKQIKDKPLNHIEIQSGGEFTWRECIAAGGEWSENYCGC